MNPMSGSSPDNLAIPENGKEYTVLPSARLWLVLGNPGERMKVAIKPVSGGDLNLVKMFIWSDEQANEILVCWQTQKAFPSTKGMIQWRGDKFSVYQGGNAQSTNPWIGMVENLAAVRFVFSIQVEKA